ncbi:hypothetical protein RB195_016965 [Necator americanus]|uniref:Uncharacterized protein n=1 Tax=Necator americanus TaxID=51031 RepID=A0ABR1C651_NECAM
MFRWNYSFGDRLIGVLHTHTAVFKQKIFDRSHLDAARGQGWRVATEMVAKDDSHDDDGVMGGTTPDPAIYRL